MEALTDFSSLLATSFIEEDYIKAIKMMQSELALMTSEELESWMALKSQIQDHQLPEGLAMSLVLDFANEVLYENTEEEAYRWLDLLINNLDKEEDNITTY